MNLTENSPIAEAPEKGKRKDITAWPISWFDSANPLVLGQRADHLALSSQSSWFLDQLLHEFGTWKVILADNKVDTLATVRYNLGSGTVSQQAFRRGCWMIANRLPRSKLLPKQTALPHFSALVPLILAGIKRYQDIPYSAWSRDNLTSVMPEELAEAITTPWPEITIPELLALRAEGLLIRSGTKAGTSRDAKSAWILYGINDSQIGTLNKTGRLMITQCWVCHPQLRHGDMITQPQDWDSFPEPLIEMDITKPKSHWSYVPWEQ